MYIKVAVSETIKGYNVVLILILNLVHDMLIQRI